MKKREFDDLLNTSTAGEYVNEPCVALCEIKEVFESEKQKDYTGKPFFDIKVETEKGLKSTIRLWRATDEDTESAKEFKLKRLKEFLTNAEANFTDPKNIMKSIIGKRVFILFRTEEYIGYDKDFNRRPEIRTKISMNFSSPEWRPIQGNQSYFHKKLSDQYQKKFDAELLKWEEKYGGAEEKVKEKDIIESLEEEEDDLPF